MTANKASAKFAVKLEKFVKFVNDSGSPFHVVLTARKLLDKAGFSRILESELHCTPLRAGGRYYITRNHSSFMAFIVGKHFNPLKQGGIILVAAHTDSPCLKLRSTSLPNALANSDVGGVKVASTETYGGGLWHTWLDRGLGVAGKIVVLQQRETEPVDKTQTPAMFNALEKKITKCDTKCDPECETECEATMGIKEELVYIQLPLMCIPNLAIHLQSNEERAAFKLNRDKHLRPLVAVTTDDKSRSDPLLEAIAKSKRISATDILSFELCLMDATEPRIFGVNNDFIESPRLDNLTSCWAAVEAICDLKREDIETSEDLLVVAAFDHEEVGSASFTGAGSTICESWLRQIVQSTAPQDDSIGRNLLLSIAPRSFIISADAAHAVHPNYPEKHLLSSAPLLGKGVVLKHNANQRYATECTISALLISMLKHASKDNQPPDLALQHFSVANESACGSTIGPILATRLGFRTADVGIPILAMHSIRETCAVHDLTQLLEFLRSCFVHFRAADCNSTYL